MRPKQNSKRDSIIIFCLFAFSLALRIFHLDKQSLWLDEAVIYTQISKGDIFQVIASIEGHLGPFYHIILYFFTKLAGFSEWALRFPSAIYGSVSVAIVFLIAQKIIDRKSAFIASFLMMFSPLHIWYSQEARMYSLWIMLLLFLCYIFILLTEKPTKKRWILFTIVSILSIWTYLNTAFFFTGLFLFILLQYKQYKKLFIAFTISMITVIISFYPGIIAFLNKEAMGIGSTRSTGVFDLAYAFLTFCFGTTFGPPLVEIRQLKSQLGTNGAVRELASQYGTLLLPSIIAAAGLIIYSLFKLIKHHSGKEKAFFISILLAPASIIFLVAFFTGSIPFNVRYVLCALPFFYMFIAIGIRYLSGMKLIISFAAIFFILSISLYNHYENPSYAKVEMNKAIPYVSERMKENDKAILFYEHARVVLEYYDKTTKMKDAYVPLDSTASSIIETVKNSGCVYFIQTVRTQQYPEKLIEEVKTYLQNNYGTRHDKNFVNTEILTFCKNQQ